MLAGKLDKKIVNGMMNDALKDAGPIVMITAPAAPLGAVVKATGAAQIMADGIVGRGHPRYPGSPADRHHHALSPAGQHTAMITGSAIIAPMLLTLGVNPYRRAWRSA